MSFMPPPDHKGIDIPYKLQKVAYYRENTQVWFKFTPKVVKTLIVFGAAIPAFWIWSTIEQDKIDPINRNPRKI